MRPNVFACADHRLTPAGHDGNRLLALAPPDARAALLARLVPVRLERGQPLCAAGAPVRHVYFPTDGLASVAAASSGGAGCEVALFGRDGMSAAGVAAGTLASAFDVHMHTDGAAYRIDAECLLGLVADSVALAALLARYAHTLLVQSAHTGFVNAMCAIEPRLARWLRMAKDRIDGDTIAMTHDRLAAVLGVRRPGITTACHVLEGHGLIRNDRGRIVVRDADGLAAFAAPYGVAEAEYQRMIGWP